MNKLTEEDFATAAQILGCDIPAVKAVTEVESRGGGFLPDGRPKILFEGHWFYRYTKGKFAASHPTICYRRWTKAHYIGGAGEYDRLNAAIALDRTAALLSASYGAFQVMGFNFAICGFTKIEDFYAAMQVSEGEHLKAFCQYVKNSGLADELRRHDWAGFAKGYNGAEYKKNAYDSKLARAWRKHGGK